MDNFLIVLLTIVSQKHVYFKMLKLRRHFTISIYNREKRFLYINKLLKNKCVIIIFNTTIRWVSNTNKLFSLRIKLLRMYNI